MSRLSAITFLLVQFGISFSSIQAANLTGLNSASFERLGSLLDEFDKMKGAQAAAAEIAVARVWIENGRLLLREGSVRKAATIAERLPAQLELIRVLIATGAAVIEAELAEQEIGEMEKEILLVKVRYNRLMLQKNGARVSGAFPPVEGKDR